jgi:drug/metabolite transporter (DMT)-like permease
MIYLVLSILASSVINLIFKLFDKYHIDNSQAITINYIVCVLTGLAVGTDVGIVQTTSSLSWLWFSLGIGLLFIVVFVGMAQTTRLYGISVAVVAAKMGVVFPVLFGIVFLRELVSSWVYVGIILSLISVFLTSVKKQSTFGKRAIHLLPFLVFIGSGCIDITLKYIETILPPEVNDNVPVLFIFATAGILGFILHLFNNKGKLQFTKRNVVAGLALGVPNYFSIYFIFRTLHLKNWSLTTAQIFPINNIGIVVLSTILSVLLFREKLSTKNMVGIGMAVAAIIIIGNIFGS